MTRDSWLWPILVAGALLTGLTTQFDLLHQAFPGMSEAWDARLSLLSLLVGTVAGVMGTSPLHLSSSGRAAAAHENANQADHASSLAAYAARKAEEAVVVTEHAAVVTEEAAKAADVAKEVSAEAADTK